MNERAVIGGNNPPVELFEQSELTLNDLYEEAGHWLDGKEVETPEELDAISMLLDNLRKAEKLIDGNRKTEKKPHDDAGNAVQEKYKPLIDKAKLAQDTCKKAMQPYMLEQERIRQEQERIAREEAEQAEREALEAAQSVQSLEQAEQAAEAIQDAKDAQKTASDVAKQKTHAKGGERAIGLRTTRETNLVDSKEAARHFWVTNKTDIENLLIDLAKKAVRSGERDIPGFEIIERKVL